MPDESARVREEDHEVDAAVAEPPVPSDEVAAAVVEQFPGTVFARFARPAGRLRRPRGVARRSPRSSATSSSSRQCLDVTAVDHLVDDARAAAAGSHARALRGRRQLPVARAQPPPPGDRRGAGRTSRRWTSLTDLYPGANFPEREVFDLFGIEFDRPSRPVAHPHARRLGGPPAAQGRRTCTRARSPSRAIRARDDRAPSTSNPWTSRPPTRKSSASRRRPTKARSSCARSPAKPEPASSCSPADRGPTSTTR